MKIFKQVESEIDTYTNGQVPISEGFNFSQYKLVKRIMLYANCYYPDGKLDSKGHYKYWFDIISPRIDSEVKNIDFDTKDIIIYSDKVNDALPVFLSNAAIGEWMNDSGEATRLNDAVEAGSGWGNVVWKKVKGGYEKVDLKNFFIINQTAETLEDTPAIERHIMTQSEIRAKRGVWDNIDEVIKDCGNKSFTATEETSPEFKETPYYEVYERNGEISKKDLLEAMGKESEDGDEDEYVLAKIVVSGVTKTNKSEDKKHILYADEITKMPYKEFHRGKYCGRWFRVGLYEILFDIQTRANEIGNQLARGLEIASKTILRSGDPLIVQNILTDLDNGDIIKSKDLEQVRTEMGAADQLIADWNRLMITADKLCNSYEVVQGESLPSGTPFRLGNLLNVNANKLFDFIREKLGIALEDMIDEWILPDLIKDLKKKDILRLTGDPKYLRRFYEMAVNGWYVRNLVSIGPHSPEQAEMIKERKMGELQARPEVSIKLIKGVFNDFKGRAKVRITGENVNLAKEMESIATFIGLELDPIRRTALIEMAMRKDGIDVEDLPKSPPEALAPQGASAPAPA